MITGNHLEFLQTCLSSLSAPPNFFDSFWTRRDRQKRITSFMNYSWYSIRWWRVQGQAETRNWLSLCSSQGILYHEGLLIALNYVGFLRIPSLSCNELTVLFSTMSWAVRWGFTFFGPISLHRFFPHLSPHLLIIVRFSIPTLLLQLVRFAWTRSSATGRTPTGSLTYFSFALFSSPSPNSSCIVCAMIQFKWVGFKVLCLTPSELWFLLDSIPRVLFVLTFTP